MIIETIFSMFAPVAVEGVKQLITSKVGVKPTSIEEQIKLDQSEIEKLKAVAALDTPGGTPSQWVIDLRASSRYIAAGLVIIGGLSTLYIPTAPVIQATALEAVGVVFGFLFGSRILVKK